MLVFVRQYRQLKEDMIMTVKRLKKVLADARKAGIVIKSYKNGCFVASSGLKYTKAELLILTYGNSHAPTWLKKVD